MSNITLAIATYNRLPYVERMISSLKSSVDISRINIRIYDDCSTEFPKNHLEKIFPFAKEIIYRKNNLGADRNSRLIYEDFLSTEDDILITADSDLIYRPYWLEKIEEILPLTDGLISLYNSNKHPFINESNQVFAPKLHLGAAGTVLKRCIVDTIIKEIPQEVQRFDWSWSKLLREKGIKLYCLKESYIQHIGILGQNNHGLINDFDYGLNFIPENEVNQKIMSQFIDELFLENKKFIDNIEKEIGCSVNTINKWDYKIGHAILALPREIRRLVRKLKYK